jgi:glycosyltransferase involved in cell wall biosynthesis
MEIGYIHVVSMASCVVGIWNEVSFGSRIVLIIALKISKYDMKYGIIIPCLNEENYIGALLESLSKAIHQYDNPKDITVFICDNGSVDSTVNVINSFARKFPSLVLLHESEKGIGFAKSKAANMAFDTVDWIISLDADCVIPIEFIQKWTTAITESKYPILTGYCTFPGEFNVDFPNTNKIFHKFDEFEGKITKVFGVINICGANHAVNKDFYHKIWGYSQPFIFEDNRRKILAGDDWDLGIKSILLKQRIGFVDISNITSDRRARVDIKSFVDGSAYDSEFLDYRVITTGVDLQNEEIEDLFIKNKLRTIKHSLLKLLLIDASLFNEESIELFLWKNIINDMLQWISSNKIADFYTERNNFIYQTLEEFDREFGRSVFERIEATSNKAF